MIILLLLMMTWEDLLWLTFVKWNHLTCGNLKIQIKIQIKNTLNKTNLFLTVLTDSYYMAPTYTLAAIKYGSRLIRMPIYSNTSEPKWRSPSCIILLKYRSVVTSSRRKQLKMAIVSCQKFHMNGIPPSCGSAYSEPTNQNTLLKKAVSRKGQKGLCCLWFKFVRLKAQ